MPRVSDDNIQGVSIHQAHRHHHHSHVFSKRTKLARKFIEATFHHSKMGMTGLAEVRSKSFSKVDPPVTTGGVEEPYDPSEAAAEGGFDKQPWWQKLLKWVHNVSGFRRATGPMISVFVSAVDMCLGADILLNWGDPKDDDWNYVPPQQCLMKVPGLQDFAGPRSMALNGLDICFPGESLVSMADGSKKRMDDLELGDQVLVWEGHYKADIVVADFHQATDRNLSSQYLAITVKTQTLFISENHMLFKDNSTVIAADIEIGDNLQVQGDEGMQFAKVESVQRVSKTGLYAPLTMSGRLIVDGILVSSFALHTEIQNSLRGIDFIQGNLEGICLFMTTLLRYFGRIVVHFEWLRPLYLFVPEIYARGASSILDVFAPYVFGISALLK